MPHVELGLPPVRLPLAIAETRKRQAIPISLALTGVLAACATSPSTVPGPTPENPLRGLDAYIERAVSDWGIAGLSVAVVAGDSVVFAEGYGVREVGRPEPVDENTLFAIGSNTKLFTAVAAGMMVDEGTMQWSDAATEHLPAFQLYDPYVSREITVRDLLSHRSGLGRRGDLLWYGTGYDRAEILRRVRFLEPNSSFRSEFGYQNIMFLAAGEAVAAAAGESWDDVIEQRIFRPLGMTTSNTSTRQLPVDGNVATPHLYDDGELVPVAWHNIDNMAPAGSINSSALEMAQWLRMLLGNGCYAGTELIEAATLAEITSPQTLMPFAPDSLFPSTHFAAYGLGVAMRDYHGAQVLSHTGGIDGMLSLVALIPQRQAGMVILTNTEGHNNLFSALMYRIADAYLGAPTRDWSAIFLARLEQAKARTEAARAAAAETRVTGTTPSLTLEGYAGTYENEMYGNATVTLENGALFARFGEAFAAELKHWHYDTFRATWPDARLGANFVTFKLDAMGKVSEMRIQEVADFDRAADDPAAP
ncbi:MAG: serine hydrolase [Longimicrobiaceae bacterium]